MKRLIDKTKISGDKTTVPKSARNMFNLNDGDELLWFDENNKLSIEKNKKVNEK